MNKERLRKVADSIWTSKARYGLQLYGEVRTNEDSRLTNCLDKLQKAQNKMLRTLENVRISDKISVNSMLIKHKMLSINQLNAQIKLTEMWKANYVPSYPLEVQKRPSTSEGIITRGMLQDNLVEVSTRKTFIGDASRVWNKAPIAIRNAKSLSLAKQEIRKFCVTLPI